MKARTYNTAGEMRASFRSASNKRKQIVVLADLNECGLNEVADVVLGCCDLSQHELNGIKRDIMIDRLWRDGKSDDEIGQAVGTSLATISSWRQRNGRENLALAQAHRKQDSKMCKICHKMLPATTEFFNREAKNRDGLQNECKICRKSRRLEKKALEKQGLKRCKTCEGVFPATLEYFYSNGQGLLQPECKTCRKVTNNRKYQKQSEDANMTPHECQEMRKLLESYKRVNFERQERIQELIEENYELQKRILELERRQT